MNYQGKKEIYEKLRAKGYTYEKIGKLCGVTRQAVHNRLMKTVSFVKKIKLVVITCCSKCRTVGAYGTYCSAPKSCDCHDKESR